jgi:hypothetical protein
MDLSSKQSKLLITGAVAIVAIGLVVAWCCWPRANAISAALHSSITQQDTDQSLVAKVILDNYKEARSNASRWSGVYWGFTFLAAIFSALAGVILKVESILKNSEQMKKDVAALLAVCAALLITISTSGDFQRKWQANRVAASELERTAYDFLENNKTNEPRKYFSDVGNILHKRNLSIVGNVDRKQPEPAKKSEPEKSPEVQITPEADKKIEPENKSSVNEQ